MSFTDYASGIRLPNCSKLAINRKNNNGATFCRHDVIANFFFLFWRHFISIVRFSYWSNFHFNIITGSGVMTVFFIRNWSEIRKSETPPSEFSNISRLGQAKDTKFGVNVSNEMLLNATKCQGYTFYHFWVIKGKPTGG